jgi:hypothetical protein
MANGRRDRDYWRIRKLRQQISAMYRVKRTVTRFGLVQITPEYAELDRKLTRLTARYGHRSMVGDKRRRNSTRRGNSRWTDVVRRIEKKRGRAIVRADVASLLWDVPTLED